MPLLMKVEMKYANDKISDSKIAIAALPTNIHGSGFCGLGFGNMGDILYHGVAHESCATD